MVWCLLYVDWSSVLTETLESFAEDRIQGLRQDEVVVLLGYTLGHKELHPLKWVSKRCGVVEEYWHCALLPTLHFKLRIWRHALNRETSPCQVEIAGVHLLSKHLHPFHDGASQTGRCFRVEKLETTGCTCVWTAERPSLSWHYEWLGACHYFSCMLLPCLLWNLLVSVLVLRWYLAAAEV